MGSGTESTSTSFMHQGVAVGMGWVKNVRFRKSWNNVVGCQEEGVWPCKCTTLNCRQLERQPYSGGTKRSAAQMTEAFDAHAPGDVPWPVWIARSARSCEANSAIAEACFLAIAFGLSVSAALISPARCKAPPYSMGRCYLPAENQI